MPLEQARRRVRLRDLETLVAVAHAGGMRKAAAALSLSQPAVSKAMAELEDAVGVRLLERSRRGVETTAFGAALVRRAEGLIDGVRGALRELSDMADPEGGEVRMGSMVTLLSGIIASITGDLLLRHPRLKLIIESGQSPELINHFLVNRLVDFVVARPHGQVLPAGLALEPLFHDRLLVIAGRANPLTRRRRLEWAEVHGHRWILSSNECRPDSPVIEALQREGLPLPRLLVQSGGTEIRFNLLEQAGFLTCIPHSLLPFMERRTAVRVLPLAIEPWRTATSIVTLRDRSLPPAAELFLAHLRERARPLAAAAARARRRPRSGLPGAHPTPPARATPPDGWRRRVPRRADAAAGKGRRQAGSPAAPSGRPGRRDRDR